MSKLTWTTEMERVLLQSMVEQARSGKRAEFGFKKEAWVISVDQVKVVAKLPDLVTMKKAKDKLDTLKTKWNIWWKLRYEVSGWGWNETTQLFEASPEQWERYTETYPTAASLRYHPLLNRDLLADLFERNVAGGKEAISIHALNRQVETAKYGNNESVPGGNESRKNQPSSPEIFSDDWKESLSNTPQGKSLPEPQLPTVSQLIQESSSSSSSSFEVTPFLVEKQVKENSFNVQKNDTPKEIKDKNRIQPKAAVKDNNNSENTGKKRARASEGALLLGSLDAVVEELREGRLQRAKEVRAEKRQRKAEMEEQRMPPVHCATKMLIEKYGDSKKELIPWALKAFLDETKAQMFLSLEGEWQEQWLISVCEEIREGKK